MNTGHLLLFLAISAMLLSSVFCILFVTIRNSRAVKKFYRNNKIGEIISETREEAGKIYSPATPIFNSHQPGYFMAS